MITLLFVRHGETAWNREGRFQGIQDIPLNEEGRRQAIRLANGWDQGGDFVLSSPLRRAWDTASILSVALGLPIETDDRLVERDYGEGAGLTLAERRERFPDGVVPGVETSNSLQERAANFLDDVVRRFNGRRVIAVSHGGFINALLALVSGGQLGTGKTLLGNASVSVIEGDASGWVAGTVGRTFETQPLGLRE
jgi:uncharacterized phosphatase